MKAIVVVDKNWGIGKDNDLLVHLPGDLKYFKEQTLGQIVVYGRKTLESFPKGRPLPGRENIVLTRNENFANRYENDDAEENEMPENLRIMSSVDEVLEYEKKRNDEGKHMYICGGENIYRQFIDCVDEVLVTKLDAEFEADKYFPNLDEDPRFELTWESEVQRENGISYRFTKYMRK